MARPAARLSIRRDAEGTQLEAVAPEPAVKEVEFGGAPVTDEVLSRILQLEHLPLPEMPYIREHARDVAPAMADPIQGM